VTDAADLTHAVLLKVAEFIRKLPTDQLNDLAEGTAKLELVPKGGRPARAGSTPTIAVEQIRADLVAIDDTAAAQRYLADLKLTVAALRALAKELAISVPSKATKDELLRTIVQWTVGRRRDAEAVSRPAPSPV
jgi:hypothetical protein